MHSDNNYILDALPVIFLIIILTTVIYSGLVVLILYLTRRSLVKKELSRHRYRLLTDQKQKTVIQVTSVEKKGLYTRVVGCAFGDIPAKNSILYAYTLKDNEKEYMKMPMVVVKLKLPDMPSAEKGCDVIISLFGAKQLRFVNKEDFELQLTNIRPAENMQAKSIGDYLSQKGKGTEYKFPIVVRDSYVNALFNTLLFIMFSFSFVGLVYQSFTSEMDRSFYSLFGFFSLAVCVFTLNLAIHSWCKRIYVHEDNVVEIRTKIRLQKYHIDNLFWKIQDMNNPNKEQLMLTLSLSENQPLIQFGENAHNFGVFCSYVMDHEEEKKQKKLSDMVYAFYYWMPLLKKKQAIGFQIEDEGAKTYPQDQILQTEFGQVGLLAHKDDPMRKALPLFRGELIPTDAEEEHMEAKQEVVITNDAGMQFAQIDIEKAVAYTEQFITIREIVLFDFNGTDIVIDKNKWQKMKR